MLGHSIAAAISPRPVGPSQRDSSMLLTKPNAISVRLVTKARRINGRSMHRFLARALRRRQREGDSRSWREGAHRFNDAARIVCRQVWPYRQAQGFAVNRFAERVSA